MKLYLQYFPIILSVFLHRETTHTASDLCTSLLWSGVCRQPVHVCHDDFLGESRWAGPIRTTGWSSRCDERGARGGAWRGTGWWIRGRHGRRCFGRGRRLWQDGRLLIGARSGRELDRCFWLNRAGRVPMVQEAWAGVVSGTGPTVVSSMVVEMMSKMWVDVLFRLRQLEGTLASVMECIEGRTMGWGWWWLVDSGERFERLVKAVLEQPGGASEEQAGARLHQACWRLPIELLLSGPPALTLERSPGRWRFTWSLHFILSMKRPQQYTVHESHMNGTVPLSEPNK